MATPRERGTGYGGTDRDAKKGIINLRLAEADFRTPAAPIRSSLSPWTQTPRTDARTGTLNRSSPEARAGGNIPEDLRVDMAGVELRRQARLVGARAMTSHMSPESLRRRKRYITCAWRCMDKWGCSVDSKFAVVNAFDRVLLCTGGRLNSDWASACVTLAIKFCEGDAHDLRGESNARMEMRVLKLWSPMTPSVLTFLGLLLRRPEHVQDAASRAMAIVASARDSRPPSAVALDIAAVAYPCHESVAGLLLLGTPRAHPRLHVDLRGLPGDQGDRAEPVEE